MTDEEPFTSTIKGTRPTMHDVATRAGVSLNTDFAEAEVDQRRINLTRFPLRFPERRDFFLEGSSVFSFAPGNGIEPYFSRKIGLLSGEQRSREARPAATSSASFMSLPPISPPRGRLAVSSPESSSRWRA